MSEYKISVILPVYNVERYIEEALGSLIKQSIGFSNLQIIFVDDKSTDNSRNMIRKYEEEYENVFGIYLEENSHASGKPRNEGLNIASGKYVMFLDPDDMYDPQACEILYQEMEQGTYSCVAGYYKEINEDEEVINENSYQSMNIMPGTYQIPEDLETALKLRSGFWAKIYSMELIKKLELRFLENVPGQDMVFYIDYLLNSENIKYINVPIVYYRVRNKKDKSISFSYNKWFFEGISKSYEKCLEIFKTKNLGEKFAILFEGALNFYIQAMIDSELQQDEIRDILFAWEWAYEYDESHEIKENDFWYAPVKELLFQKEYEKAANVVCKLRYLRKWNAELKEAVAWYKKNGEEAQKQIKDLKENGEEVQKQIKDLKEWVAQLEEARDFFKGQMENFQNEYQKACERNDTLLKEFQTLQSKEAESAEKIKSLEEEISTTNNQTEEQVEKLEHAELEAKKWKYKYNRLMSDKAIEKIARKKNLDI